MSFATSPKNKPTQQAPSQSWEDKYPNECPLWLNIVGWSFVFVPLFFI
ncbi:hypothetical protein [Vibrio parahaemolyticus]|nr:hypothetical protein [Vibrio parahaemolyticus]